MASWMFRANKATSSPAASVGGCGYMWLPIEEAKI
jgi:hypothetical protein